MVVQAEEWCNILFSLRLSLDEHHSAIHYIKSICGVLYSAALEVVDFYFFLSHFYFFYACCAEVEAVAGAELGAEGTGVYLAVFYLYLAKEHVGFVGVVEEAAFTVKLGEVHAYYAVYL